MGLFDELLKQSGGIAGLIAKNPQIVSAALSMLSTRDTTVGGSSGLGGLVGAFQKAGLGEMVSQWISTGPNPPISPAQVSSVLGADVLAQFAQKAGIGHGDAASALAAVLPAVVDHLTPNGQLPETNALEGVLGGLLAGLSRR